jgi:hypothetical protein
LNGVLSILRTGAPSHDLPRHYPAYQTCHRRFELWHVASASAYEPYLPRRARGRFFADLPTRLIGDRGYDSDALDETLMTTYRTEMIAAHRRGRRVSTQDGRCLRRARRGRKIQRLFARLRNFVACCISPMPAS